MKYLEGGLAPEATVMSWRGETGGIEAVGNEPRCNYDSANLFILDHYQEPDGTHWIEMGIH